MWLRLRLMPARGGGVVIAIIVVACIFPIEGETGESVSEGSRTPIKGKVNRKGG